MNHSSKKSSTQKIIYFLPLNKLFTEVPPARSILFVRFFPKKQFRPLTFLKFKFLEAAR